MSLIQRKKTNLNWGMCRVEKGVYVVKGDTWRLGLGLDLVKYLGRGTYGAVCEAREEGSDKKLAVKKMSRIFDLSVSATRLLREVAILNQLEHPNIVRLNRILEPPGGYFNELYIVFEYAGLDLQARLMQPEGLTLDEVKSYMAQMISALSYLHHLNIFHRDLKPANVLVDDKNHVRLCDFGLSRVSGASDEPLMEDEQEDKGGREGECMDERRPVKMKRRYSQHVVSSHYRAPEVIFSNGDYNEAIDMWAAGCIFHELLLKLKGCSTGVDSQASVPVGPLFGACNSGPPLASSGGTTRDGDGESSAAEKAEIVNKSDSDASDSESDDGSEVESDAGTAIPASIVEHIPQVNAILNVVGTPSTEEIEIIEDEGIRSYLSNMKPIRAVSLKELHPTAPDSAVDLLQRMLKFDPRRRCTTDDALRHEFFADCHLPRVATILEDMPTDSRARVLRKTAQRIEEARNDTNSMCALLHEQISIANARVKAEGVPTSGLVDCDTLHTRKRAPSGDSGSSGWTSPVSSKAKKRFRPNISVASRRPRGEVSVVES